MIARGAKGLFLLKVPTDDPLRQVTSTAPANLKANKAHASVSANAYGAWVPSSARSTTSRSRPGKPAEPRLLYDPLQPRQAASSPTTFREAVRLILHPCRYNYPDDDPYVFQVLASIVDPVKIREPLAGPHVGREARQAPRGGSILSRSSVRRGIHSTTSASRGYVEPPRAGGRDPQSDQRATPTSNASPSATSAKARSVCGSRRRLRQLPPQIDLSGTPQGGTPLSLRLPDPPYRSPPLRQDGPASVDSYCIDTFTPLSSDAYKAARRSERGRFSGASSILEGNQLVYSLCRPPGHHAERDTYGGFCYFCNARSSAQYLVIPARQGRRPRRRLPSRQRHARHLLPAARHPHRVDSRPSVLRLSLFFGLRR